MTGPQQYVNILKQELHKIKELQLRNFFFLSSISKKFKL